MVGGVVGLLLLVIPPPAVVEMAVEVQPVVQMVFGLIALLFKLV